jgi:hypothetical protein
MEVTVNMMLMTGIKSILRIFREQLKRDTGSSSKHLLVLLSIKNEKEHNFDLRIEIKTINETLFLTSEESQAQSVRN